MKLVVVNGLPGCGKTTFENLCMKNKKYTANIFSTVDKVKEFATIMGWDGTKTPANRKFLSDLKDILTEWRDFPYVNTLNRAHKWENEMIALNFDTNKLVAFIDVREPDEIAKFAASGATTVVVKRNTKDYKVTTENVSNHADANVYNYSYDYVINNDGTLEDLQDAANVFLMSLFEN